MTMTTTSLASCCSGTRQQQRHPAELAGKYPGNVLPKNSSRILFKDFDMYFFLDFNLEDHPWIILSSTKYLLIIFILIYDGIPRFRVFQGIISCFFVVYCC